MSIPLNKIMIVEDEEDIRTIVKLALENIGHFQILLCSSGQEAVQNVENFNPDLILLDVMMPMMDGVATLKELRTKTSSSHIPVIFMTARVQPGEITQYLDLGAIDVISTPFNPITLAERLVVIWEKYHASITT
jgi:CheY-like chemotaxis protein